METDMTIDEQLQKIRQISDELEQGGLPLEKALARYEEGIRLIRRCSGQIDRVEKSIEVIEDGL